jgi:hypothetical protein
VVTLRNKPTTLQLIGNLSFVKAVDLMLMEGTSSADVARFIQDDQHALTDIRTETLVDALARRKESLRKKAMETASEQTKRWFDTEVRAAGPDEEEEDDDGDGPEDLGGVVLQFPAGKGGKDRPVVPSQMVPSAIARNIYDRHIKGGVDELVELEALYRAQVHRMDRLITIEEAANGYIENLNREMKVVTDLLMARVAVKEKFGLIDGDAKFREQLDIKGYSEKTVATLSNPEKRHRVVSLIEKIARLEGRRRKRAAGEDLGDEKKSG